MVVAAVKRRNGVSAVVDCLSAGRQPLQLLFNVSPPGRYLPCASPPPTEPATATTDRDVGSLAAAAPIDNLSPPRRHRPDRLYLRRRRIVKVRKLRVLGDRLSRRRGVSDVVVVRSRVSSVRAFTSLVRPRYLAKCATGSREPSPNPWRVWWPSSSTLAVSSSVHHRYPVVHPSPEPTHRNPLRLVHGPLGSSAPARGLACRLSLLTVLPRCPGFVIRSPWPESQLPWLPQPLLRRPPRLRRPLHACPSPWTAPNEVRYINNLELSLVAKRAAGPSRMTIATLFSSFEVSASHSNHSW